MTVPDRAVQRLETVVDGVSLSYLHAGSGPSVLLVHGTFWSRVWEPVMADLAAAGHVVYALDFRVSARPRAGWDERRRRFRRWPAGLGAFSRPPGSPVR